MNLTPPFETWKDEAIFHDQPDFTRQYAKVFPVRNASCIQIITKNMRTGRILMPRRFLIYIAVLLLLLSASCAKRNTEYQPEEWLTLEREIPVVGNALDVHVDDNAIYVAQDQGGFSVIQRSDFSQKWYTSMKAQDGSQTYFGKIRKIAAVPEYNRLLINEVDASDRIIILNTTNPDTLEYLFEIIGGTSGIKDLDANAMSAPEGTFTMNLGYCYADGFRFDKYDGLYFNPPLFTVDPPTTAMGFGLTDNVIAIAAGQRGLFLYDRDNQQLLGELALPGEAQKVVIKGNLALVPSRQAGLNIVDISNPALPVLKSTFDTTGYATVVDYVGEKVAVSSGSGGIYLLDISDPAHPELLERLTSCGYTNSVEFMGDKLVAATRDQGVLIYKLK